MFNVDLQKRVTQKNGMKQSGLYFVRIRISTTSYDLHKIIETFVRYKIHCFYQPISLSF